METDCSKEVTEAFHSYDLDVYMHAVNVDINLASLNDGIRKESVKQTKQCLDLADEIGAIGVTAHPGKIGAYELENLTNETGCSITIDLGHVNTCEDHLSFFKIPNILYNHINDNDGIKDKHQAIGDGTLDLNLLKYVKHGIIELNNFDNVLKSKKVIEDFLKEN